VATLPPGNRGSEASPGVTKPPAASHKGLACGYYFVTWNRPAADVRSCSGGHPPVERPDGRHAAHWVHSGDDGLDRGAQLSKDLRGCPQRSGRHCQPGRASSVPLCGSGGCRGRSGSAWRPPIGRDVLLCTRSRSGRRHCRYWLSISSCGGASPGGCRRTRRRRIPHRPDRTQR